MRLDHRPNTVRSSPTRLPPLVAGLAVLASLLGPPLGAATLTVCVAGCDAVSIQGAIDAASPGDVVRILAATAHVENNIVVDVPVTIEGLGEFDTAVEAAASPGSMAGRIFVVAFGTTAVLRDLSLRYGSVSGVGGAIHNLGHLTLERVTVGSNDSTSDGGGIYSSGTLVLRDSLVRLNESGGRGGGIFNASGAVLEARDSQVQSNDASSAGGNLFNEGTARLARCGIGHGEADSGGGVYNAGAFTFSGDFFSNHALGALGSRGGAIYQSSGSLDVRNSRIWNNDAVQRGGGVYLNGGSAVFTGTTFEENEAEDGGAIYHASSITLRLHNSTLSGNRAANDGGAVYVGGGRHVAVSSSTVAGNVADGDNDLDGDGGGFSLGVCTGLCAVTSVTVENTIVADNTDLSSAGTPAHECDGDLTSGGYSLVESASTTPLTPCRVIGDLTGVWVGVDPMLGSLADNGGVPTRAEHDPPRTMALEPGSAAIDQGDPMGCVDSQGVALPADQRGAARVGRCDIGAFERGGVPASLVFSDGFESGDTSAWSGS